MCVENGYIYLISGVHGQGCYVGQTKDATNRWYQHQYLLNTNTHGNPHLNHAWVKNGSDAYAFVVIEECLADDRFDRETYWHDRLKDEGVKLYNIAKPGLPPRGKDFGTRKKRGPHSEETRRRMSEAHSGRRHSPESIQKMSETKRGHTVSEETRRKIAESLTGRPGHPCSEEAKRKISKANRKDGK